MMFSPAIALGGIVTVPATRSAGGGKMICTVEAPKAVLSARVPLENLLLLLVTTNT